MRFGELLWEMPYASTSPDLLSACEHVETSEKTEKSVETTQLCLIL